MISPLLNIIMSDVWEDFTQDIAAFKAWRYFDIFMDYLENLNRDALFRSPVHGEGHIERTMLHGGFAAFDNDLSEHETRLLLTMCSYHDTGRLSDWLDDAHGLSSTFKLPGLTSFTGDDLETMKAGIEAHSRADKDMEDILKSYATADFDKTLKLAKFLKDSDGLDRVRLSDLDTKFLRNETAVKRAEFSKFLFEAYTKEQERLGMETGKKRDYFDKDLVTGVRDGVHEKLLNGKNAWEIVTSELCRLLDFECEFEFAVSCKDSECTCGCYLGACAFLEKYLTENKDEIIAVFKDKFVKQYKSVKCIALRPAGIRESDPVHICAALLLDTVLFTYRYITAEI